MRIPTEAEIELIRISPRMASQWAADAISENMSVLAELSTEQYRLAQAITAAGMSGLIAFQPELLRNPKLAEMINMLYCTVTLAFLPTADMSNWEDGLKDIFDKPT